MPLIRRLPKRGFNNARHTTRYIPVNLESLNRFSDGTRVDFEALRISDFWASEAAFGERVAFESPVMHYPRHVQPKVSALLWIQRVPVTRRATLEAIRLPRNVAVHVFALTLRRRSGAEW